MPAAPRAIINACKLVQDKADVYEKLLNRRDGLQTSLSDAQSQIQAARQELNTAMTQLRSVLDQP